MESLIRERTQRGLGTLLVLLAVLVGCGGGQTTVTPDPDVLEDLGDWEIRISDGLLDGETPADTVPDEVATLDIPPDSPDLTDAKGDIPDLTGDQQADGWQGGPCDVQADCPGGYCVESPPESGEKICAMTCVEDCPDGLECRWVYLDGGEPVSVCLPPVEVLCKVCASKLECLYEGAHCIKGGAPYGYCGSPCDLEAPECPAGFQCAAGVDGEVFGVPQCIPAAASCCVAGGWLDCDDDNPCTADSCHPSLGCQHSPQEEACSGPSPCTQYLCVGGECVGWPITEDLTWDGEDDDCDGQTDEDVVKGLQVNHYGFGGGIAWHVGGGLKIYGRLNTPTFRGDSKGGDLRLRPGMPLSQ
ncbi:MAG: hypothetical protein ABIK09_10565 [Pseudomonadota bacterium]